MVLTWSVAMSRLDCCPPPIRGAQTSGEASAFEELDELGVDDLDHEYFAAVRVAVLVERH